MSSISGKIPDGFFAAMLLTVALYVLDTDHLSLIGLTIPCF
jgi:hypothetical protein